MDKTTNDIFYKTYGKNHGYALVFLHGYLESSEIWDHFADLFADEYFVICIDLPGHGKTLPVSENSTIENMAEAVISVTDHLDIPGFHLAGHSMGGYVSMALLEKYSDRLNSVVLFHSTCFADTDEKKLNREREIEMVKSGKREMIINTSIPRLYANDNLKSFTEQIERSLKIAFQTSDSGIISALNAMKSRPDRTHILAGTSIPVLLIGGRKDNLIPFETMEKMKALSPETKLVCLENSGHMGFFEEKDIAAKELKMFFDENFECL
jgi:pimeloyl-ACP methyl ester carboxylesterase